MQVEAALGLLAQRGQGLAALDRGVPQQRRLLLGALLLGRSPVPGEPGLGIEAQAQGIMVQHQRLQRRLQHPWLQRLRRRQQHGLVPVMRIGNALGEEPALDGQQRQAASDRALVDAGDLAKTGHTGQGLHGLVQEQVFGAEHDAGLTGPADHLDRDDRIAAQFEEIVGHPNLRDLQHRLPNLHQRLLERAAGGHMLALQLGQVDCRQGLAVDLAVGGQGHAFEQLHVRGHHVVRQVHLQTALDRFAALSLGLMIGRQLRRVVAHHVADQLLAARAGLGHHHRFAHTRHRQQASFHLAQLDTKTSHLDLAVDAPEVIDDAAAAQAYPITAAVQPGTVAERVRYEPFGSERRALEVATGQTLPAQVQLSRDGQGQQVQVGIEHIRAPFTDAITNGRIGCAAAVLFAGFPDQGGDHGFGRAVAIDDVGRAQCAPGHGVAGLGHRIAAEAVHPHRRWVAVALGVLGQLLKVDRWKRRDRHPMLMHGGIGLLRRPQLRVADQQRSAVGQGREPALVGTVEGERHEVQFAVGWRHFVALANRPAVHGDGAMGYRHPFGQAGGTRGVDDVGQVIGLGGVRRRVAGLRGQVHVVQGQGCQPLRDRQALHERAVAEQQGHATVLHQVGQAFAGVLRIERRIGTAGLEHRQQAHDHLKATLQGDTDQHFRPDPGCDQGMGQAVGLLVKLGKAHALLAKQQGGGLRGLRSPLGNALVHQRAVGVTQVRGVAHSVQVLMLIDGQHRQRSNAARRVGDEAAQQGQPMAPQALDGGGIEQVARIGQRRPQAVFALHGVQRQVERGAVAFPEQPFDIEPRHLPGALVAALALVVVHHLEQRVVAQAAVWLQSFDQLFERQVLMRLGTEHRLLDLLQQRREGQGPLHIGAQHLRVDEEAQQAIGLDPVAVGVGHPDANIGLAGVAVQQHLERRQQQHEQRDLLLLRQALQGFAQGAVDGQVDTRAAQAWLGRTRTVGGQLQHRLMRAQLLTPVGQLLLAAAGFHPATLPDGVVGVLNGQRGQLDRPPVDEAQVQLHQLIDHDLHRPAIGDDVVLHHHQHMFIVSHRQQPQPYQRTVFEVEGPGDLLLDQRLYLGVLVLGCQGGRQVQRLDRDRQGAMHALAGPLLLHHEGGAQGLVACHQGIERLLQGLGVELAAQAQGGRDVRGAAAWLQLPEEPLALLGEGQRQAVQLLADDRNRQVAGRDLLFGHLGQVLTALVHGQGDEALGNAQGAGVIHYTASISSSKLSSWSRVEASTAPPSRSSWRASSPRVGYWKINCAVAFIPSSS